MKTFSLLLFVTGVVMTADGAKAQTTPTPATDPAVVALQTQQAIADAKLKILQDQQASLTAMLPSSSTTPNTGAISTSGNAPFPCQKMAYTALMVIASEIADAVAAKPEPGDATPPGGVEGPKAVVMFDATEFNNVVNLKAVMAQIEIVKGQLERLGEHRSALGEEITDLQNNSTRITERAFPLILAPALIEGSLKAVADILGMFRTNTTIGFNGFTVDDAALVAAVAKALTAKSMTVYEPATLALNLKPEESSFLTGFKGITETIMNFQINMAEMQSQVQAISDALAAYLAADEAAQANLEQTASEPSEPKAKAMKVKQKALDRTREADKTYLLSLLTLGGQDLDPGLANILKARSDRLLKRLTTLASAAATLSTSFGTLQTSLLKLTDTGGATLSTLLRAEALKAKVDDPQGCAILSVKTSVMGGNVVTRTNLFTGGHLLYTGGAIATYTLFKTDGSAIAGLVIKETDAVKQKF